MPNIILNFTDTYEKNKCDTLSDCVWLDMRDITGTDMYCDEEAEREILLRLESVLQTGEKMGLAVQTSSIYKGIHFIDSGNYHYMTRLFTKNIRKPYSLVFFDHHTDTKPAMFDMLSCGSWAKAVLEKDPWMKKMIMIGPPAQSIREIPEEVIGYIEEERLICISEEELQEGVLGALHSRCGNIMDEPVYLSIDRDILDESSARTNWDQGKISQENLEEMLSFFKESCEIIGIDICGLLPQTDSGYSHQAAYVNEQSERRILSILMEDQL